MSVVTCPRCPAKWVGFKIEHCPTCHATFTSTRAGDRHLVDMDERGWSRHLTADEMRALRRKNGQPWYTSKTNPHGTVLWGEYGPRGRSFLRRDESDGLTDAGAGETP